MTLQASSFDVCSHSFIYIYLLNEEKLVRVTCFQKYEYIIDEIIEVESQYIKCVRFECNVIIRFEQSVSSLAEVACGVNIIFDLFILRENLSFLYRKLSYNFTSCL